MNAVLTADCLDGMRSMPDGCVDFVFADLPYGVTQNDWDKLVPIERLWTSLRRVCKPNAVMAFTATQPFSSLLICSNIRGFKYEMIWKKNKPRGFKQAQQVSSASNRVLIAMLAYKLQGTEEVPEPYSSQTCPGCGRRQKCRRVYKCKGCGLVAPRDVIGCTNIRRIRIPDGTVPKEIRFVRPLRKYPVAPQGVAGSSRGTLAGSGNAACSS